MDNIKTVITKFKKQKLKHTFTFIQCEDRKFDFIWWALKVGTSQEFCSFTEIRSKSMVNQYFQLKRNIRENYHIDYEQWGMRAILDNYQNRKTLVDDLNILSDVILGSYTSFWLKGKILLVNPAWGFRFLDNSIRVLDTIVKDKFIFPFASEKDIRIMQWKNGSHYYAKIGNTDVYWKGEQKWNSRDEAMQNAKEFLNNIIKNE